VINDMRAGHGVRLAWSDAGDRVFFIASAPGSSGRIASASSRCAPNKCRQPAAWRYGATRPAPVP